MCGGFFSGDSSVRPVVASAPLYPRLHHSTPAAKKLRSGFQVSEIRGEAEFQGKSDTEIREILHHRGLQTPACALREPGQWLGYFLQNHEDCPLRASLIFESDELGNKLE